MGCVNVSSSNSQIEDADAINKLKNKIICEYKRLIKLLNKGYKPDYQFIKDEMNFIDLQKELDNQIFLLQFYLNNKWQTQY